MDCAEGVSEFGGREVTQLSHQPLPHPAEPSPAKKNPALLRKINTKHTKKHHKKGPRGTSMTHRPSQKVWSQSFICFPLIPSPVQSPFADNLSHTPFPSAELHLEPSHCTLALSDTVKGENLLHKTPQHHGQWFYLACTVHLPSQGLQNALQGQIIHDSSHFSSFPQPSTQQNYRNLKINQ